MRPRNPDPAAVSQLPVPVDVIERRMMLDRDLAELYGVPTSRVNEQVKRNRKRFPEDFMFQLTKAELRDWISQIAISNPSLKMGLRRAPYAFTEQGVAMLSSVLNSDRAITVNIAIMRAFIQLVEMLATHKDLGLRMADLEREQKEQGEQIAAVFQAIQRLLEPPKQPKRPIGFRAPDKSTTSLSRPSDSAA